MSNFNAIDNTDNNTSAVLDFLDSLDTDLNTPVSEDFVQEENVDNADTVDIENTDTEEEKQEVTALVVTKPNSLFVTQHVFKKSVKISIKSFLISLSLGFLNLFL